MPIVHLFWDFDNVKPSESQAAKCVAAVVGIASQLRYAGTSAGPLPARALDPSGLHLTAFTNLVLTTTVDQVAALRSYGVHIEAVPATAEQTDICLEEAVCQVAFDAVKDCATADTVVVLVAIDGGYVELVTVLQRWGVRCVVIGTAAGPLATVASAFVNWETVKAFAASAATVDECLNADAAVYRMTPLPIAVQPERLRSAAGATEAAAAPSVEVVWDYTSLSLPDDVPRATVLANVEAVASVFGRVVTRRVLSTVALPDMPPPFVVELVDTRKERVVSKLLDEHPTNLRARPSVVRHLVFVHSLLHLESLDSAVGPVAGTLLWPRLAVDASG